MYSSQKEKHLNLTTRTVQQVNQSSEYLNYRLSYFESALLATILEDAIIEFRILGECNNILRIIRMRTVDMADLLAKKFDITEPSKEFKEEMELMNSKDFDKDEYKLKKLSNDRRFMSKILIDTYLCLSKYNSYQELMTAIDDVVKRNRYQTLLVESLAQNKIDFHDLSKQLRLQRNHIKTVTYETDAFINNLSNQVGDSALKVEASSRYVTKWEVSRNEQNAQLAHDKEVGPFENMLQYKMRLDQELRVHSEVERFTKLKIDDTLEQVEKWMTKFDTDMEKMDLSIQIMKNNYQDTLEQRMELEDTLTQHEELMKNWISFKDEREKARLYREKMTNAALCIQAWWRGLLVRNNLGPYKIQKKGGAKNKKKK